VIRINAIRDRLESRLCQHSTDSTVDPLPRSTCLTRPTAPCILQSPSPRSTSPPAPCILQSPCQSKNATKMSSDDSWISPENSCSEIWKHFKQNVQNKSKVKCNLCPTIFSYFGATTNFWRHLAAAHQIARPSTNASHPNDAVSAVTSNTVGQRTIQNAISKIVEGFT
jgi:hypothetical protein